jgi:hypothetical protein
MKQWLLLGIAIYIFSYWVNANQPDSDVSKQNRGSRSASENFNVIFESAPQGDDLLIAYEAFSEYHGQYKDANGFKAFAQSEGGAWAYVTDRGSQKAANSEALSSCQGYNDRYRDSYPCQLINVDGEWIDYPNRAKEILSSLPEFTPKKPIDLTKLSRNDEQDMRDKDYALALAKRIWFHHHALDVNQNYRAVRLSYNLIDWDKLGDLYPPAKTLLRHAAYYAEESLLNDPKKAFTVAHEYRSINSALGREDQSVSFFQWLDKYYPKEAPELFHLFQDELIQFELFALYNEYVSPNLDYSRMASTYVSSINASKQERFGGEEANRKVMELSTQSFIHKVSRLVAILVINERTEEAQKIVEKAQLELDSDEFIQSLNNALDGHLP